MTGAQPETANHSRRDQRTRQKSRNPLLLPLIIVSAIALIMSALYIRTALEDSTSAIAFSEAVDQCGVEEGSPYISVVDDGDSLIMTSEGTESLGASVEDIACVLVALEVPTSMINRFDTTRALDGTQTATWDGYEATWNYHPNSGSNITITLVED